MDNISLLLFLQDEQDNSDPIIDFVVHGNYYFPYKRSKKEKRKSKL